MCFFPLVVFSYPRPGPLSIFVSKLLSGLVQWFSCFGYNAWCTIIPTIVQTEKHTYNFRQLLLKFRTHGLGAESFPMTCQVLLILRCGTGRNNFQHSFDLGYEPRCLAIGPVGPVGFVTVKRSAASAPKGSQRMLRAWGGSDKPT